MPHGVSDQNQIKAIPKELLLYVYLILPVLVVFVLVDMFYLESRFLPYLGVEALLLPLFILLFNLPHIMASFFSFFDGEYIQYYKKHLFLYLPLVLIATGLLLYVNYELGLAFFLINDVWHGIKQKTGIALILGARPDLLHKLWTYLSFFLISVVYVYILAPNTFPDQVVSYISPVVLVGAGLFFCVMLAKIWCSTKDVRLYVFLVSLLFLTGYFFIINGYIFFSILAFRFVHDISAFAFYINHDQNRNTEDAHNWLYRIFTKISLPVIILVPSLAFLLAYVMRTFSDGMQLGYSVIIFFGMCHFYLESIMWKRDSIHRKYVKVV